MAIPSSQNKFVNVSDIEVVKLYRRTDDPDCVSEILDRYKYFILKVLSRWNSSNKYHVKLNPSDIQDAKQYANMAVILFMTRVKDLDRVKNVSVSIRSYVYTTLNKYYRHRWYETSELDTSLEVPTYVYNKSLDENSQKLELDRDVLLYYKYVCCYNYYKIALLITPLKNNKSMARQIYIVTK